MGIDVKTFAASKKNTEQSLQGIGVIKGEKGDPGKDGISPVISENIDNTDSIYKLDIENADGTKFTTPNLKCNNTGYNDFESESIDFSVGWELNSNKNTEEEL